MKKPYLFIICFLGSVFITADLAGQITNPTPYCELNLSGAFSPGASAIQGDGITNITLGTLNHSTYGGNPDTTYMYYNTIVSPSLTVGANYTLSITFAGSYNSEPEYYAGWIDFNRNNTFDANELVINNSNSGGRFRMVW